MKKRVFLFFVLLAAAVYSIFAAHRDLPEMTVIDEYVVDSELMHLLPLRVSVMKGDASVMAEQALRLISAGHDTNRKIRRLAPENGRSMSVSVSGSVASVDLRSAYFANRFSNRDTERLFVYQVVNTLTSIDGIDRVSFTIDSEKQKRLAGFVDMREVFVPDYFV